jgi:hypothetical protein
MLWNPMRLTAFLYIMEFQFNELHHWFS